MPLYMTSRFVMSLAAKQFSWSLNVAYSVGLLPHTQDCKPSGGGAGADGAGDGGGGKGGGGKGGGSEGAEAAGSRLTSPFHWIGEVLKAGSIDPLKAATLKASEQCFGILNDGAHGGRIIAALGRTRLATASHVAAPGSRSDCDHVRYWEDGDGHALAVLAVRHTALVDRADEIVAAKPDTRDERQDCQDLTTDKCAEAPHGPLTKGKAAHVPAG
eukprot:4466443-Prymnesium_polylepis.1